MAATVHVTAEETTRQERIAQWLVPFLAMLVPVLIAAAVEQHFRHAGFGGAAALRDLATPRWDALNYLAIAQHGYTVYICPADYKYAGKLCGTVGWYPGWPLVLVGLKALRLPFPFAYQAWTLDLGLLYAGNALLLRLVRRYAAWPLAAWGIIAAAAFPGSFYYLTAFPYGLVLVLLAGYLLSYQRFPWRAAALGAALSLTYPQVAILALVPLTEYAQPYLQHVWQGVQHRWSGKASPRRWLPEPLTTSKMNQANTIALRQTIIVCLPLLVGPLLLAAWFQWQFHQPWLYFQFQSRYGWHVSLPFDLIHQDMLAHGYYGSVFLTILASVVVLAAFASFTKPLPFAVYGLAALVFFLCLGSIRSIPRYDLLLPLALWIATARVTWWRVGIILVLAWASIYVCQDYFNGTLI